MFADVHDQHACRKIRTIPKAKELADIAEELDRRPIVDRCERGQLCSSVFGPRV